MPQDKKATSRDVARLAGVSQTTVSYVMSGRRTVAPETERRVLDAMRTLGYQPHSGARALRSNRTNVIGAVVPYRSGADSAAQHRFLVSLAFHARRHGYDLLLVTTDEGVEGLHRVINTALCDGLLIMEVLTHDPRTEVIASSGTPAVFIGVPDSADPVITIDSDYVNAGKEAISILARTGHQTVTLVSPDHPTLKNLNFLERFRNGVHTQAQESGVILTEYSGRATYPDAQEAVRRRTPAHGDAFLLAPLVSADDWCNALHEANATPGEVTTLIASSWDEDRTHTFSRPAHFDMRITDVAQKAVELLIERLHSDPPDEKKSTILEPKFISGNTMLNSSM